MNDRLLEVYEQPEQLISALNIAGMRHKQTVRADIVNVALAGTATGQIQTFFCQSVVENISTAKGNIGDEIPASEVFIAGKEEMLKDIGSFATIRNALITSNGRVTLTLDEETTVEAHHNELQLV